MKLSRLAAEIDPVTQVVNGDAEVDNVCYDSRQARPGSLFVAVPGLKTDGHRYILHALSAGASALVVQADEVEAWMAVLTGRDVSYLVVPDSRRALAGLAAALNGRPAQTLSMIGVTGTDGKTSVAHLIAHVLNNAGNKTGLISTAECRSGSVPLPDTGRFTTPEAPEVQAMLARMVRDGCRWAVVEATSHALAQHRLDDCEFDVAVLTNIGLDHIDFHRTPEEYVAAKTRLFRMLDESTAKPAEKLAIVNADDPAAPTFRNSTRARAVTYGLNGRADFVALDVRQEGWTTGFRLRSRHGEGGVRIHGPGDFNVRNALAAAAVCLEAGLDLKAVVGGIASWTGAPGRMELIDYGQTFGVVVDFAHAPDSLRRALHLLRFHFKGRLIAVFGCIGERDKERRFPMGQVAAEDADYTIITDDNPYTEDRDVILRDIVEGIRAYGKREGHDFAVIPDRREAVSHGIHMAVDGDVVLLAGKGHEREVHLPGGSYECDDREVARQALRELARGR